MATAKKSGKRKKPRTAAQKAATAKMLKANRAKKGGAKKGRAKKGGAKGLAGRVSRLEANDKRQDQSLGAIHGTTLRVVNILRETQRQKPIKRLPGYASPVLGSRDAAKALPSGRR